MGVTHTWQGVKHREGWQEWFPAPNGLPPRDLTEDDVAAFNATQLEKLHSPAGHRLYEPVDDDKTKPTTTTEAPAPRAKRPRVTIDDAETETGDTDGNK